jgi:hypothetical protein
MGSSPYDLAQMALHDAAAVDRFPGPDSYMVLGWIHEILAPETYVEIGVHGGISLRLARESTSAIGIDPAPLNAGPWPGRTHVFRLSSYQFFSCHDLYQLFDGSFAAFAFVDGLHQFEQVLTDLQNLERYAGPHTVIALHDTIPLNRETSARNRTTEFYTGDVWKILPFLREHRPDLDFITVATAPAGLTLIRGLDSSRHHSLPADSIETYAALDFDYFLQHHDDFLGAVANDRAVVEAFCQNTPVQSIVSKGMSIPSL